MNLTAKLKCIVSCLGTAAIRRHGAFKNSQPRQTILLFFGLRHVADAEAATKAKVLPSAPAINTAKFGDDSRRHHAANLTLNFCQSAMGFLPNIRTIFAACNVYDAISDTYPGLRASCSRN